MLRKLVVGLPLNPSSGIATDEITTNFVVGEDENGEGKSREPPREAETVHPERISN